MKPSELKITISVKSYDEKTADKYRNGYVAEKRTISKLWKISIPNWRREAQIKDLNERCVNEQMNLKERYGRVGSGRAGSSF